MHILSRFMVAGLLTTFTAGCAGGPAGEDVGEAAEAQTAGGPRDATAATVAAALLQQGVISASEAQMLVPLGTEGGWTVMLTPGLPSNTARLSMIAVGQPVAAGQSGQSTTSPIARWSTNQWGSFTDTAGQLYTVNTAPVLVFKLADPTQIGNGAFIQAAVRVGGAWLSQGGANYRFVIPSPYALSWLGAVTAGQQGVARAIPGQSLFAGHDTSVTVDTYPMLPNTAATLHWTSDGYATIHDVPMDLAAVNVGAYGNDARWVGTIPTSAMSAGPTVAFWAEASSNGPGGTLWDSRNGQNYVASVAASPQATWAQLGAYQFLTSQSGWYYGFASTLADPLSATPGDFQAYAASASPAVEVYAPGITDAPGGASACAGGFVRVEAWSPFFSGTPGGAWAAYALPFVETSGNNCRFKWLLQNTGFTQPPPGVTYPAGNGYPVDGAYPYKMRISTDGGATWQWLGTAGLPGGGGNRTVNWVAPFHG
jgi:hypothetical protein